MNAPHASLPRRRCGAGLVLDPNKAINNATMDRVNDVVKRARAPAHARFTPPPLCAAATAAATLPMSTCHPTYRHTQARTPPRDVSTPSQNETNRQNAQASYSRARGGVRVPGIGP